MRSEPFELPPVLSFWLAGHDGHPSQPSQTKNVVRLFDEESGDVLREAFPPRQDTARRVEWDLSAEEGRRGFIEIEDGDDGKTFAWLAVGRFSMDALNPVPFSPISEACSLIGSLRLTALEAELAWRVTDSAESPASRRSAAEAWLQLHPDARRMALLNATKSDALSASIREQCFDSLTRDELVLPTLKDVLRGTTGPGQQLLALLLVADARGSEALLTLIEQGAASARLLQDPALVTRLGAHSLPDLEARVARLTDGLRSADAQVEALLSDRRKQFHSSATPGDRERGAAAFKQHCAACHQFAGTGEKVGPQLDGVSLRGADRLLEDILDPSRNVDAAFRTTILVLGSGQVVTGLVRREEGATLVLADAKGKEFTVPLAEIESRKLSALSLMPSNHGETIPPEDLLQLVRFLIECPPAASATTSSN
jgi:putative heme-binding domain-containing protein